MVTNGIGRVEYARTLARRGGEEPGGDHVFEVERRVLAHQDRRIALERSGLRLVRAVPVLAVVRERDALARGTDPPLGPREALLLAHPYMVAALLRGPHHRDARVLVRLERPGRVDDEQKLQDTPALLALADHELHRGAGLGFAKRGGTAARRHCALALQHRLHEGRHALLDARTPG